MTAPLSARYGPTASTPTAVDAAAAGWLVRRQDGLDAAEEAAFQTWLAASPSHQVAFERVEGVWDRLGTLPTEQVATLRRQDRRRWRFDIPRLVPLAAAACTAFILVGGWLGWDHWQRQPTYSKTFATARGQQLDVQLPDGSRLRLDTATRAEVTLYRQRREVRLPAGQAMFTVRHDAGKPFDVLAGPVRVTVVGTRFSVRNTGTGLGADGVRVTVEEGRVRVAPIETTGPETRIRTDAPVLLGPGEAVAVGTDGALRTPADNLPGSALLWREGRVNFENTPLAQALAEFERYGPTGLVLHDPTVGALRIHGSFDLRQLGAFTRALPQVLPVQLRARDGLTEIAPR